MKSKSSTGSEEKNGRFCSRDGMSYTPEAENSSVFKTGTFSWQKETLLMTDLVRDILMNSMATLGQHLHLELACKIQHSLG